MQIVIDIPEEMYQSVLNGTYCGTLYEELKNGTPLPKGHGRLVDIDEVRTELYAPTIIDADKREWEE